MECPKCKHISQTNDPLCEKCGYNLKAYISLSIMKDELSGIGAYVTDLSKRFDSLKERFERFEDLIPQASAISKEQRPNELGESQSVSSKADKKQADRKEESDGTPPPLQKSKVVTIRLKKQTRESEIKFGQKWLLIAGVVLTVLAVGWFLKYSFEKNWVTPAGRVAMSYLTAMAFLGCGEFFRRKDFETFGLYLIGGGIATLYFSTFAAFQIYHLLSQGPAFGVMILVTLLAGCLALVYDTKWLALLGLIGGFLTPVILSTGQDNQVVLMTYMVILNAGILSIAFFKQWRLLNYLGLFFTWTLFSGWFFEHYELQKFWRTIVFLNIFFGIYAFVPFAYHLVKERGEKLLGIGLITPNSFTALAYCFAIIKERFQVEYVSIITVLYAAIFLWMAWMIYNRHRENLEAYVMMLGKAMLFLVLTIPILFSANWITFFWAIQASVLLWASVKLKNRYLYISFSLLMLLTLLKFFFYDTPEVFHFRLSSVKFMRGYARLLLERLITSVVVLGALFQSSRMISKQGTSAGLMEGKDAVFWWSLFGIALFCVLNIETGAFFHDYLPNARFAAISVLWALFSIGLMALGFMRNISVLRQCAIGLFAVTMIKVFFVDMANVSTPYRIISFLILGLMLIIASYLYYRFKDSILPSPAKEETGT